MPLTPRQQVETLGQDALTAFLELRRAARCPVCDQNSLAVDMDGTREGSSLLIYCTTATGYDGEEPRHCDFSMVIHPTDLAKPPFTLDFVEKKVMRKPIRQRKTAPRARARATAE